MAKQNNNIPKGFKPSPLGPIPVDWNVEKLGDFVEITSGDSPSLYSLSKKGKYPYLKVEDLNNCDKYQKESREYSNDEKGLITKNSIIFPKRGAAILNNKVRINSVVVQMDSNLMAISPKSEELNFEYLYYRITYEKLYKIADTSTIPQINNKHIIPYRFPLPCYAEQCAIALGISTWDKAIQTTTALIAQKELGKKWLMQQLLTGKKRLKGFKGEWKEVRLGDVCGLVNGMAFKPIEWVTDGIPIIRIQNLNGSKEFNFYNGEIEKKILVNKGDLLFAWSGSRGTSFGSFIWHGDLAVLNQHIFNVFPKNGFEKDFAFQMLRWLTIGIETRAHGSAGLVHVTKRELEREKVRIPKSSEEQTAIANVLRAADNEIQLLKQKLEQLKEQKKGLMQQLLTGKKRLKVKK